MQHLFKIIYLSITLILFIATPTWAKSTDLACEDVNRSNPINERWKCPDLGSALDATLSDLDAKTGYYTCEYRYPDTQQVATVCTYLSTEYKSELNATLADVHKELVNSIKGATRNVTREAFYEETISDDYLSKFASEEPYKSTVALETDLIGEINSKFSKLSQYYTDSIKSNKNGYLYKLQNNASNHNPLNALNDSYENFVKPYISGSTGDNNVTFSHFVTGLVTLDESIIRGYNESNGTLLFESGWTGKFTTNDAINEIKKVYSKDNNSSATINPDRMNISGWISIFQQKIWGFYYNLQRRLDLGYDIISTQLLFIMMVFFSMMMAVRGGARYIINRENGESSGEVKINEASIMKTLGILAAVFTFYISVPYDDQSTGTGKKEIKTNASLSKTMIRIAMNKGADFGTMISDLGTDAFLRYVVQQQGVNNGLKEGDNVIKSIMSLVYYYPAYEVVNACRYQTGLSDDRILSGQGSVAISPEFSEESNKKKATPDKYSFYDNNEIKLISDALCQKMISQTSDTLHRISYDLASLLAMIEDDKFLRMEATYNLVHNHVLLQKELGWMNIASIPYTYFVMKNYHLFYTSTINYEDIAKRSEKYAKNIGLRGGQDAIDSTLWIKDITETTKRLHSLDKDEDYIKEYTRLAVYNFLPGFSGIRNEVLQRIQSLFSDMLRLQRGGAGKTPPDYTAFSKLLNKMTNSAANYYGKINKIFTPEEIRQDLKKGLGGNGQRSEPVLLHKTFYKISYLVAMGIWKTGFILVFLSAIAMVIGLKVVMYIIAIMVHFFISPFIVVWAFATSADLGATKIKNYLRDTLIYMLYPTMIVIGVFMFIFAYELFYNIYGFITSMLIEGQTAAVESAALPSHVKNDDARQAFLAVYALKDITEILIDLLSVYVAFLTINKFPELVLKMMGVGDSAAIMLPQANEAIQNKGGGSVSPLSR